MEKKLEHADEKAYETSKAQETFLANMSHEIRTPMTAILGLVQLLSKTGLDDQQKKFAKLITESANNLLNIVNDVLDIEKIAAGKLDLEYIPFRLEEKVFTTLQSFQFKAEDRNISLLLNSSLPEDLIVIGDPYRLSQILNNLLSNALKFTRVGEISISMDFLKNEPDGVIIGFQVHDTGIGIPEEKLSLIFSPFVQANTETSRKFGGTGLGLTICKNLTEMQGGNISVQSLVGHGTTFSFYLPYKKGDVGMLPKENNDNLNFKDLESVKILVAEDVELNQFLVKHILESWGCEVTLVGNGAEAVEKVKKYNYDLVLMDIQMPEMDGLTATSIIRGLNVADKSVITKKIRTINVKDKSDIPIIALTANALKGDGQRYIEKGMNGYITKPYTEEKLFQVINEAIKNNDTLRMKLAPANIEHEEVPVSSDGPKLYDLTTVNNIGRDDQFFARKLITIFLENMHDSLDELVAAGKEQNYLTISSIAHKMKSNIDLMGIHSIKDTIRELEYNKTGSAETANQIEQIRTTLEQVFVELRQLLAQN